MVDELLNAGKTFQVDITLTGIWSVIGKGTYDQLFVRVGRKTGKQVWDEWAARSGLPGLGGHFQQEHSNELGYDARNKYYNRKKFRAFGRVDPYVSPERSGTKMRDLIKQPGSGYRVTAKRDAQRVVIEAKFPGARRLNSIPGVYGPKYRREFLRLNHPTYGRPDREWMLKRWQEIFWPAFNEALAKVEKTTLRGRELANKRFARKTG